MELLWWKQIIGVSLIWEGGRPRPPKMRRVRTRALPEDLHLLTMSGTISEPSPQSDLARRALSPAGTLTQLSPAGTFARFEIDGAIH